MVGFHHDPQRSENASQPFTSSPQPSLGSPDHTGQASASTSPHGPLPVTLRPADATPAKRDFRGTDLVVAERPARILVADDEHLPASALATSLRSLGYQVIGPVSDGRSAVHAAETELPDMCILDIKMPELDGLHAAHDIWSNMGIPAVLVSAFSHQEYVDRAMATGVFGYLLKPVNADHLRVAIGVAWSRAKQQDVLARRVSQLEQTIENRKTIEQAKWMLVSANGFDEPTAHTALQRYARTKRQKLYEVASLLLNGELDPAAIVPRILPRS